MTTTSPLKIGDIAPSFSLSDQDGKDINLSDYAGVSRVLLVFYPGDLTPGCTMQLCALRDDWSKFTALDTVILGVNPADAESHTAFKSKFAFPFPLLIDKTLLVAKKYGATRQAGKATVIKRMVVVIEKDGKIRFIKNGMPKDADILKALASPLK